MDKVAVYPGSFDPITNGHLDLLERGLKIFDQIVIAIATNPAKKPVFSLNERLDLIRLSLDSHPLRHKMRVDAFDGLLVEYVKKVQANAILRGLRAISDFEYEFQMALMNRKLSNEIETLYLMPLALLFLGRETAIGRGAFGGPDLLTNVLLILAGPVTALPLVWF
ncbi:MAG: pantetheine-phosphate adenylyltransferase, partial [Syntrophobacteraceae bacterium]|nr:pantetheine-phosphate adenylyltransferase [Syntrophobacteraceae bacterium]